MNYYQFLLKKTIKNRSTFVPLLILLAAIVGLYIINNTTGDNYSYTNGITDHYNQTKELEEYYVGLLNDGIAYSDEEVESFEEGHQDVLEQSLWSEKALELAGEQKWGEALDYSINILHKDLEVNEQADGSLFPADYVAVLNQEIELYEQLKVLEQEPDTPGYETFGFNYVFRVMDSLFPVFFVLILAVLLTEVFLNSYKKGLNIETLLPMSFMRLTAKRIVFSGVLAGSVYIAALTVSFIMASIVKSPGTGLYPVLIYSADFPETTPIWIVLLKMLTLQSLGILSVVLLISLISFFIKNNLVNLLVSLVTVIGSPMVLRSTEAFHSIAHLNPFTYLASGDVVTRLIIQDINNANATFGNGIMLLCVFSFALIIINVIFSWRRDKISMYVAK